MIFGALIEGFCSGGDSQRQVLTRFRLLDTPLTDPYTPSLASWVKLLTGPTY